MTTRRGHDRLTLVLIVAIIGYLALAYFELSRTGNGSKSALTYDGAHNALELFVIGFTIHEHRRKLKGKAASTIPIWNARVFIFLSAGAILLAIYRIIHPAIVTPSWQVAGIGLASFSFNGLMFWLNRHDQHEPVHEGPDHNHRGARLHFAIDSITSGGATLVYVIIAFGGSMLFDPLVTIVLAAVAIYLSRRFIKQCA